MRPLPAEAPPEGVAEGIKTMRAEAKRYLTEMNMPASLAGAMFMASPYVPHMLSAAELRRFRLDETDVVFQEVQDYKSTRELGLSRRALAERKRQYNEIFSKKCNPQDVVDKYAQYLSDSIMRLGYSSLKDEHDAGQYCAIVDERPSALRRSAMGDEPGHELP